VLKDYLLARSVDDVLSNFRLYPGKSRVIAGGTDVVIEMKSGKLACDYLIDISKIQEFKRLDMFGDEIFIGATVTHNDVNRSELIKVKAPLLAKASGTVGSIQIRNTATVVGNVITAQPAADAAVALMALGAVVKVVDVNGSRDVAMEDMYSSLGKSSIDSTRELVTFIHFPALGDKQGSSFVRLAQRESLALPILNVATVLSMKDDDTVEWVRIVMGPVGNKPIRARKAEKMIEGLKITNELLNKAAITSVEDANPRSSGLRGSAEYRKDVLKNLVFNALEEALATAKK
jgi:CO/xanthine dehydrogenase FAD-binding subunit